MERVKLKGIMSKIPIMFMCAIGVTLSSCSNPPGWFQTENQRTLDSTTIVHQVESIVNPEFNTVDELIQFRTASAEGERVDSVFMGMSIDALRNAASVVIKRNGHVSKRAVVQEYEANRSVYDNLPKYTTAPTKDTAVNVDLGATDLGNRPDKKDEIISTKYGYRTDTVDGVPRKVQIKTEESYVE